MIILEKSRLDLSPVARDFGQGVSVVMRPLTSTEYGACKAKAADLEAKYLEGAEALSLVGLPPYPDRA
ncbi:hypothetical protein [uncultured Cohaesibacter sp.]|uniref:hypothetical protein n=1 Tax=uncultured Cohaesibacter sp. TaxID=1002546 RepID=UPI0029C860BC|nr:hypothetical protein [uncultured Cohaesibacter sp.]